MPRTKVNTASTPKAHKRQLSGSVATVTPSTRSSKRIKTEVNTPTAGKITPKKSKYFEGSESEEEEKYELGSVDASESAYEDNDISADEPSEPPSETDDYDSEADKKTLRKPKSQNTKSQSQSNGNHTVNKADLWKEGVKTGLGPGKQVFIAKPKPRGDGGIKYQPDRIHPNTMLFLADLKRNNDREWLKLHDPDYRQSWKDWESFVETLTENLTEVDETIPELPPKDLVFRIYRDVRFSKDPTPYKPHFSAAWSRTGRKGPYAAYYVQIQPGGRSFVGAGLWCPDAQPLGLLRRSIDRRPERLRTILTDPNIRKKIFGGISNDEKKAIKAFTNQNAENALKSKPKGYEADHPSIELLRLRNYTMGKRLTDEDVATPLFVEKVTELFRTMFPFVTHLNSVVMPDEDAEDEDDNDDDGDDDNGSPQGTATSDDEPE